MKKLLALLLCIATVCAMGISNSVYANGLDNSVKQPNETIMEGTTDEILKQFNESSVIFQSPYNDMAAVNMDENDVYNQYKDYAVLYQQNTGINTLDTLFSVITINNKQYYGVEFGEEREIDGGYLLKINIEKNPAEDKEFIKTPQNFDILINCTLSNKKGESTSFKKNLKSQVVEVVGKIINRKSNNNFDMILTNEEFGSTGLDYLQKVHKSLKIQLQSGSIIDVVGIGAQCGSMFDLDGKFLMSALGGYYDLKYLLEDSNSSFGLETYITGYVIDDNKNIIDGSGNILVPSEKREIKSFSTNIDEIKINAKVGTIPDSAIIKSKERTDLKLDKQYVAYDMNIFSNNEKIQPNGNVDLSIKIPNKFKGKKLGVYYLNENGNLEELNSTIKEEMITFTTDHFSTYVVMEKEKAITPTPPATVIPAGNVKTGDTTMPLAYASLFVVSAGILFVLRKISVLNK